MGMLLLKFLASVLKLFMGILTWIKLNQALAAILAPPASARAARLKLIAALCFMTGAALLLAAALLWSFDRALSVNEMVGWCGLVAFGGFLILGLQCHRENRRAFALNDTGDPQGDF
jgi:hypothetical protein